MKAFFDITPSVSERIGVFPGDIPFRRKISLDFKKGHHLLLSSIESTLHLGAHADGPNHYAKTGVGIGARDLTLYMGRCLVLDVSRGHRPRISYEDIDAKWRTGGRFAAPRVLFKTLSFPDPDHWNSDFAAIDPDLIAKLAGAGVRLIGIDTPSIDPEDSKALEAHQAIARHDLAILEGLVLNAVPEGLYSLMALPLKLEDADAAPVRAVLFQDPDLLEA